MRPRNVQLTPPKRPHKGYARVWHPGKGNWVTLGKWGSAAADEAFKRLAAEYVLNPGAGYQSPKKYTVSAMVSGYLESLHANPKSSDSKLSQAGLASESVLSIYGEIPVSEFGPVQLRTWAATLVSQAGLDLSGTTARKYVREIIMAFRWAIGVDAVRSAECRIDDLERTDPLAGLSYRGPKRRRPASDSDVRKILAELTPVLADAVRVHLATGMRSAELLSMRPIDVHRSGLVILPTGDVVDLDAETKLARKAGIVGPSESVWLYVPEHHKKEREDRWRAVPIVPAVQKVIEPYLVRPALQPLFSPQESTAQFRTRQRANRKSKVQPSQRSRAKKKPRRKPGERYNVSSYYHAVQRACDRAGVTRFFPHQLRHAAATRVAGDGDGNLRGAQALLGHAELRTTEGYARLKISGAVSAAAKAAG